MVIVNCPKCGKANDLTEAAKAEAATAGMNRSIDVEYKCRGCEGRFIYGPFDPWAARVLPDQYA